MASEIQTRHIRRKYGDDVTIRDFDKKNLIYEVYKGGVPIAIVDYVGKRRGYVKELARVAEQIANYKMPKNEKFARAKAEAARRFGVPESSVHVSRIRKGSGRRMASGDTRWDFVVRVDGETAGTMSYDQSSGAFKTTGTGRDSAIDLVNSRRDARERATVGRTPASVAAGTTPFIGGAAVAAATC